MKRLSGRTYSAEEQDTSYSADLLTDQWDLLGIQVTQVETDGSLDVDWDIQFSNNGEDWVASGITQQTVMGDGSAAFLSVGVTSRYVRVLATVNAGEATLTIVVNARGRQD